VLTDLVDFLFGVSASGIMRFRIHQAKDLAERRNAYIDIIMDGESVFSTRAQRNTTTPIWDASTDFCIKNLVQQKIAINLRDAKAQGEETAKDKADPIIGYWKGDLGNVVGHKKTWIPMHDVDGTEAAQLCVSIGYAPITVALSEESAKSE
jgi:hypothetical protein